MVITKDNRKITLLYFCPSITETEKVISFKLKNLKMKVKSTKSGIKLIKVENIGNELR